MTQAGCYSLLLPLQKGTREEDEESQLCIFQAVSELVTLVIH